VGCECERKGSRCKRRVPKEKKASRQGNRGRVRWIREGFKGRGGGRRGEGRAGGGRGGVIGRGGGKEEGGWGGGRVS